VRRQSLLLALAVALAPVALTAPLAAQSSQFGVRGLGLPGRALSTRALGTGGGFGLFDAGSSLNPASIGEYTALTATFGILQNYRRSENSAGTESGRDTRFPQIAVAGPLKGKPISLGASFSNYTDRDFSLATSGTELVRGVPVDFADTLSSRGGISDLRVAGAYRMSERFSFGVALHALTGVNRSELRRTFGDTAYRGFRQRAEVSYAGVGFGTGMLVRVLPSVTVAVVGRRDGHVSVERDSTPVGDIDMPYLLGGGVRWRPAPRLDIAGHLLFRGWSRSEAGLRALGGVGADNTTEAALGLELVRSVRRPTTLPIRLGARWSSLPFPIVEGDQPSEFSIAAGTGLRFADSRGGIDLAVEHVRRSATGYRETAWIVALGVTVRP
jgi:hypothetical protein